MSGAYIARGLDGRRSTLRLGEVVHRGGGAGRICAVQGDPASVAKLYHDPARSAHYGPKIEAMLRSPPDLPAIEQGGRRYEQIAWPTAIIEDGSRGFAGFLMPFIDLSRADSLDTLLVKALRKQRGLPENYAFRVYAALNTASMVAELHRRGHHIIDLKPQNMSVYKDSMYVAVVDCDGLSIDGGGTRFPGHQFTDGYRAPEAVRAGFNPEQLGEEQDRFALAVVLFQLLNNGIHPFQGVPRSAGAQLGTEQERINGGLYPYGARANERQGPSPSSIHTYMEDTTLALFERAFVRVSRPSAVEWREHLRGLVKQNVLARCRKNPDEHAHFSKGCGLCTLDKRVRKAASRARRRRLYAPSRPKKVTAAQHRATYAPRRTAFGLRKRTARGVPPIRQQVLQAAPGPPPALTTDPAHRLVAFVMYFLFFAVLAVVAVLAVSPFMIGLLDEAASQYDRWERIARTIYDQPASKGSDWSRDLGTVALWVAAASFVLPFAYKKQTAGDVVESHCLWLFRCFAYLPIPFAAALALVVYADWGVIAMALIYFWVLYRCIKGFRLHLRRQPVPNPAWPI
jgi:uncharacterized membrane protein